MASIARLIELLVSEIAGRDVFRQVSPAAYASGELVDKKKRIA
jgi:hypothetical protein